MAGMREAFAATATDLLETDDRVAIVVADISVTLLARAIRHDPLRAVNVGIAEQTMVGVAAGFAMEGFHPIAHSLSPFMAERPYEQLKLDFGYQGLGGTFVGSGGSYDYAGEGGTHHSPADASLMIAIPRMQMLVPGHGREVDQLLRAVVANGEPTYVRTSLATNGPRWWRSGPCSRARWRPPPIWTPRWCTPRASSRSTVRRSASSPVTPPTSWSSSRGTKAPRLP
jgi:transketolase